MGKADGGLRTLPSVERLLNHPDVESLTTKLAREWITRVTRGVLEDARVAIRSGKAAPPPELLALRVAAECAELRCGGLTRVVNATGVVLHTNLGRAPISSDVVREAVAEASGCVSVELDLETGERGNRYASVQRLLSMLTGCESSVVVNNNAAAVLLVLNTFARGRDVVLSRGEMIEIGGSFRLPEIIRSSGANLVEVGATNRTHLSDYRKAAGPGTALFMKAHCSNYRVVGFTSTVSARELMKLSEEVGVPVYEDLGSGSLVDLGTYGLTPEPTVQQVVASGIPLVSFSGDKLLGGPQAGLIVGKRKLIDAIQANHLLRALRVDKLTMALLERTLQLYLDPRGARALVPVHFLLARKPAELREQAEQVVRDSRATRLAVMAAEDESTVGGGACPSDKLPTCVVEITHAQTSPDRLASRFRGCRPPVLGRIRDGRLCLDMRTVTPAEVSSLVQAIRDVDRQLEEKSCPA